MKKGVNGLEQLSELNNVHEILPLYKIRTVNEYHFTIGVSFWSGDQV